MFLSGWESYTWRHWCVLAALLVLSGAVVLAVALPLAARGEESEIAAHTAALDRVLSATPLIDGLVIKYHFILNNCSLWVIQT